MIKYCQGKRCDKLELYNKCTNVHIFNSAAGQLCSVDLLYQVLGYLRKFGPSSSGTFSIDEGPSSIFCQPNETQHLAIFGMLMSLQRFENAGINATKLLYRFQCPARP